MNIIPERMYDCDKHHDRTSSLVWGSLRLAPISSVVYYPVLRMRKARVM